MMRGLLLPSALLAALSLAGAAQGNLHWDGSTLTDASGAQARSPRVSCVRKTKAGYDEPKTLKGLMSCQEKRLAAFSGDDKAREAFSEAQRAETRAYLARHPERASTDAGEPSSDKPDVAAQKARTRAAVSANAARLPADQQAAYEGLNEKLWTMSKDGEDGLTPAMAQEIVGYLQKQQGGVSAEMSGLLGSLEKDGSKLSDGSVRQLKKAARDAKGEGLELGVDDKMEKWLLDPGTDPAAKDGGGANLN